MKTKAVRLHGEKDLRLDEFDLPPLKQDEILAKVVSDSICMSSYKLALQGEKHKRVRYKLSEKPPIIGHEFCGEIIEAGAKWKDRFSAGEKFVMQPALNVPDSEGKPTVWAPGYSYEFIGGNATYIIIPKEVTEVGCLLDYKADNFYLGSLAEPMSCIIGAYHAQFHTRLGSYIHEMGIVKNGAMALLGAAGPMGLGAIDYAIHADPKPGLLVVTDIDENRLKRAAAVLSPEEAAKNGVRLVYVNTKDLSDPAASLKEINNGKLFNDVFVYAPVRSIVELGARLLGSDGCLNFFAGPTDTTFSAEINFYDVHYNSLHFTGTSGGNTDDLKEAIALMTKGSIDPSSLVTHVGGLNCVPETTINLDKIPGGKKLVYTHKDLPLTAIADFEEKGKTDPFWKTLAEITRSNNNLWCREAEDFLLKNAPEI